MPFYCRFHEDFEGLDIGKFHEHMERDHKEVRLEDMRAFIKENMEWDDARRSDSKMVVRTWGRPPKLGNFTGANEVEKK